MQSNVHYVGLRVFSNKVNVALLLGEDPAPGETTLSENEVSLIRNERKKRLTKMIEQSRWVNQVLSKLQAVDVQILSAQAGISSAKAPSVYLLEARECAAMFSQIEDGLNLLPTYQLTLINRDSNGELPSDEVLSAGARKHHDSRKVVVEERRVSLNVEEEVKSRFKMMEIRVSLVQSQLYVAAKRFAIATEKLRHLVAKYPELVEAWFERAMAYYEMGVPSLADLNITQPAVDQQSKRVQEWSKKIKTSIYSLQRMPLASRVADEVSRAQSSHVLAQDQVRVLMEEISVVFQESFFLSAAIKAAAALRILIEAKDHSSPQTLHDLLLFLARSNLQRESGVVDAISYCTQAMLLNGEGKMALRTRASCHEMLGHFSLAAEDLVRLGDLPLSDSEEEKRTLDLQRVTRRFEQLGDIHFDSLPKVFEGRQFARRPLESLRLVILVYCRLSSELFPGEELGWISFGSHFGELHGIEEKVRGFAQSKTCEFLLLAEGKEFDEFSDHRLESAEQAQRYISKYLLNQEYTKKLGVVVLSNSASDIREILHPAMRSQDTLIMLSEEGISKGEVRIQPKWSLWHPQFVSSTATAGNHNGMIVTTVNDIFPTFMGCLGIESGKKVDSLDYRAGVDLSDLILLDRSTRLFLERYHLNMRRTKPGCAIYCPMNLFPAGEGERKDIFENPPVVSFANEITISEF